MIALIASVVQIRDREMSNRKENRVREYVRGEIKGYCGDER